MDGNALSSKQLYKVAVRDRLGYEPIYFVTAEGVMKAADQAEAQALADGFVAVESTVQPTTWEQVRADRAKAKRESEQYLATRHEPLPVLPIARRWLVRVGNHFDMEVAALTKQSAMDKGRRFANGCSEFGKVSAIDLGAIQ